jgi:hypothetical protein
MAAEFGNDLVLAGPLGVGSCHNCCHMVCDQQREAVVVGPAKTLQL